MDKQDIQKHLQIIYNRLEFVYNRPYHAYMIPKFVLYQFVTNRKHLALGFAFFFASFSTGNSLFLSEVLGLPVCELCWFQRIFMYPLSILAGIACFRRDTTFYMYGLPLSIMGCSISAYHSYIQRFGYIFREASGCSIQSPSCSNIVRTFLGLSIPNWALIGFIGITVSLLYIAYVD